MLSLTSAAAEDVQGLYRVDLLGIGSCYDADLWLMLPAHAYAYLEAGTLEVRVPNPGGGIKVQERVIFLGDNKKDFSAQASRYIQKHVLGKDVLLAFDSLSRSADGSLPAYIYLPDDGTCVNLELIRNGFARVASPEVQFQFRPEFEMYEKQARNNRKGIWIGNPYGQGS
jgi:endonuclease YncB( thermonuclease family)